MRLAILGFGVIGGSVARALAARRATSGHGTWSVAAWSPSGRGPSEAAADGTIETAAGDAGSAVDGADVVVLAGPPLACLSLLDDLAGPLRGRLGASAVVTDVASTKARIVERAEALGLPFVGGHPMAGVETTGYGSADAELFVGRPWVLCGGDGDTAARVAALASATGAIPLRLDAAEHDRAVAAISHVPLVLSAALVEAVLDPGGPDAAVARRLAAGGWASMTRLARGDPEMGAGIAATNAAAVAAGLRDVRDVLDRWLAALESGEPDAEAIRARLEAARALLDEPS